MIKVLNIISDSNIGGAGRCILNFLKYYDRKNYSLKVVVPRGSLLKEEIEKLGTRVIEADGIADKSFDRTAVKNLVKIIKKQNPDIVHTHGAVSGRIAAKLCGKRIIYTRHSVFPVSPRISHGIGRVLNKAANEFLADEIIAVAEAAKDNLTEGGISENKIKVILNGVEKVERCTENENASAREAYGITPNDFVVGIMARLEEVKGHIYLIEAAERIKKAGKNIKVLIIGTGAIEDKLKGIVKEKNLEDTILFTGFITDVRRILSILTIQANASYGTEATSLALLEGMSMGIPAVVSDYGGNPGVITHGENGFLFRQQDSGDMERYLLKIMEDKALYHYMCERSLEIFQEKFTAEIYARNIEAVYSSAINQKRGAKK